MCENYNVVHKLVLRSDAVWVSSPQMVADEVASLLTAAREGRTVPPRIVAPESTSQVVFL